MKGTILDFDEKLKSGQILGEDGNRYLFKSDEWKSKNKNLEIDLNVDFLPNDNQAKDIFNLSKNINTERSPAIKTQTNSSIKKINFEELEKEVIKSLETNPEQTKKRRNTFGKSSLLSFGLTIGILIFSKILDEMIKGYHGSIFQFIFLFAALIFFISAICLLLMIFVPKSLLNNFLRKDLTHSKYKEQLKIINYTPNDLKFETIEMIHVVDKTMNQATKKLINKAYELKADAIINYSYQSTSASKISTSTNILSGSKDINTKVDVSNIISGLAIRVRE